jgi:hypothetical protein
MKVFLTNLKTKEKIAEKRKTTEETEPTRKLNKDVVNQIYLCY